MVEIVRASAHQHHAIANLLEAVFIGEGFAPASSKDRLRQVDRIAAEGELLVAQDPQGQVMGIVVYVSHGSALAEIAGPQEGEIRLLAVQPALRARGAGRLLLQACIERACRLEHRVVVLSTQPSMAAAQSLYAQLGFIRAPQRDWVHANGSVRLVYSRGAA